MKKLSNRKFIIITITALFVCVFQLQAVFEGRDEKLQEYTAVRNNVTIEACNTEQKAAGLAPKGDTDTRGADNSISGLPISDFPLFFLLLCGFGYGVYAYKKRQALVAGN